jgi:hypothetical protein
VWTLPLSRLAQSRAILGPQQSESGAPTRPRRLNIVAHSGFPFASTRSAKLDDLTAARSFEGACSLNAATREVLEIGAARL